MKETKNKNNSKIVNQNTIVDIIRDALEQFDDIITLITSISGNVLILQKHIDVVKNAIKQIYGEGGVVEIITQASAVDPGITPDQARKNGKVLDIQINEILHIINRMVDISKKGKKIKEAGMERIKMAIAPIQEMADFINSLHISIIDAIKIDILAGVLVQIKQFIFPILSWMSIKSLIIINKKGVKATMALLTEIGNVISNMRVSLSTFINIFLYKKVILQLNDLLSNIIFLAFRSLLIPKFLIKRIINLFSIQFPAIFNAINEFSFAKIIKLNIKLNAYFGLVYKLHKIISKIIKYWYNKRFFKIPIVISNLINTKIVILLFSSIVKTIYKSSSIIGILFKIGSLKMKSFVNSIIFVRFIIDTIFQKFGKTLNTKAKTWGGWMNLTKNLLLSVATISFMSKMMFIVSKTPFIFMGVKLKILHKNIPFLRNVIDIIFQKFGKTLNTKFKTWGGPFNIIKNLILTIAIVKLTSKLIFAAALAGTGAILFLVPGLALIGAFKIIAAIIKIVNHIRIRSYKNILKKFLLISAIFSMLTLIGIGMLTLSLAVMPVMENLPTIILFIGSLLPIGILLISVGYVFGTVALAVLPAVAGFGAMTLMILGLAAIAYELKLLEHIKLNTELIKENIRTVLDIAKSIINSLFEDNSLDKNMLKAKDSDNWLDMIKNTVFGSLLPIKAIASSFILLMTLVSVTLITITIAILKVLEFIELDSNKIKANVYKVLDLSYFITDILFETKIYDPLTGETYKKYNKKSWLGRIFKGAGNLIEVIISSATLLFTGLSVTMIWMMANQLKSLADIDINTKKIEDIAKNIIQSSKNIMNAMLQPADDLQGKDDGLIGKLLRWLLPNNLIDTVEAIISTGEAAFMLLGVFLVKRIGKSIESIAKIDNDLLSKAELQASSIIASSKTLLNNITSATKDKDGNELFKKDDINKAVKVINRIDNFVNPLGKLAKTNSKLAAIDTSKSFLNKTNENYINNILSISNNIINYLNNYKINNDTYDSDILTLQNFINLFKTINDLIEEISPEKFHYEILSTLVTNLKENDNNFKSISKSINSILNHIKQIKFKNKGFTNHQKFTNKITAQINDVNKAFAATNQLVKTINDYTPLNNSETILEHFKNMYNVTDTVINMMTSSTKKINDLISNKSNRKMKKFVKRTVDIFNNFDQFAISHNKLDLSKLKETNKLFENMARFSESIDGNFDKLAEALTEKITPVLEELKELLEEIPDKIDANASNISSSIYTNSSKRTYTQTDMEAQVQRETTETVDAETIKAETEKRMQEKATEDAQSIEVKLDELIELLRSGQIQIKLG